MTFWWTILAGASIGLASLLGVLLTLLTLPGIWFMLIVAAACQLFFPDPGPLSWWTIGACTALAALAEVYEVAASAVGTKRAGGGRSGAIGSVIGGMLGAVLGSIFIPLPVAGTIAGAVIGAGLGALSAERGIAGKNWRQSTAIATGAAKGRLTATIVKGLVAVAIGVVLTVAAVV